MAASRFRRSNLALKDPLLQGRVPDAHSLRGGTHSQQPHIAQILQKRLESYRVFKSKSATTESTSARETSASAGRLGHGEAKGLEDSHAVRFFQVVDE